MNPFAITVNHRDSYLLWYLFVRCESIGVSSLQGGAAAAALQLPHSRAYSMAWEMCMVIRYDSFSEILWDELDGEECCEAL